MDWTRVGEKGKKGHRRDAANIRDEESRHMGQRSRIKRMKAWAGSPSPRAGKFIFERLSGRGKRARGKKKKERNGVASSPEKEGATIRGDRLARLAKTGPNQLEAVLGAPYGRAGGGILPGSEPGQRLLAKGTRGGTKCERKVPF